MKEQNKSAAERISLLEWVFTIALVIICFKIMKSITGLIVGVWKDVNSIPEEERAIEIAKGRAEELRA